jgi:nucleoside-diphosphate-sugar epimerase
LFHSAGWNVEGWVHSNESASRLSAKPYSIRAVDISQRGEVAKHGEEFDAVIHCASSGGGNAEAYREIYLNGARHLLETFPKTNILFTSSTSVYAQRDGSWVTEESEAKANPGDQPDPVRSGKVDPRKRRNHCAARRNLRATAFGSC